MATLACAHGLRNAASPTWPAKIRFSPRGFQAPDSQGRIRDFSELLGDRKLLTLVFLAVDCPLARRYAPYLNELAERYDQARFVGIDSRAGDSLAEIERFKRDFAVKFPILKDADQRLATSLGALRTPEVFVLDGAGEIRYRGRIDDRLRPGAERRDATREDLALALEELLAGKLVSVPKTEAQGCFVETRRTRSERTPPEVGAVTYADVAPLFERHCVECHRPGRVAPFSLTTYADTIGWLDTIRETIDQSRMPPWNANPDFGRFGNGRGMTHDERKLLDAWLACGAPEGPPLPTPLGAELAIDWEMGQPDQVFDLPEVRLPTSGVIEYQFLVVDPKFTADRWVKGIEIRPGNRAVLHHCTVVLLPADADFEAARIVREPPPEAPCLIPYTPGSGPMTFPPGMAKKIPAGFRLMFVMHYVTTGAEELDRTSLGLRYMDDSERPREVVTRLIEDVGFTIPAGDPDFRLERWHEIPRPSRLLALAPHMHFRGRAFRYWVRYPDGATEILLDVPKYDFRWQHRYVLETPIALPAGARIYAAAHYDNSAANPENPNPTIDVGYGRQTTDEMFNGYYDLVED